MLILAWRQEETRSYRGLSVLQVRYAVPPASVPLAPVAIRTWVVEARSRIAVVVASSIGELMPRSFLHDPNDVLDYYIDWTAQLVADGNDTIASSTWESDTDDAILADDAEDDGVVVVWVQVPSGTMQTVKVRNHIVTAAGREYDGTLQLRMREN